MARGSPTRAGVLLHQVLGDIAQRTGSGAALGTVWLEAVGRAVGHNARPESLHAGVLTVRCDGAQWCEALEAQRSELLAKLSAKLGAGVVKEIRFVAS